MEAPHQTTKDPLPTYNCKSDPGIYMQEFNNIFFLPIKKTQMQSNYNYFQLF